MIIQEYYEDDEVSASDYVVVIEHNGKTANILLPKDAQDCPWGDTDHYGLNMVFYGHYQ